MEKEEKEKREEGKGDVCVDKFISRREEGQGITRNEGRVAVTEDAVVLIYDILGWKPRARASSKDFFVKRQQQQHT